MCNWDVCMAQIYSDAYNVPVLYLRGRDASGALLPTETLWNDLCAPNAWPSLRPSAPRHDDWLTDSVYHPFSTPPREGAATAADDIPNASVENST